MKPAPPPPETRSPLLDARGRPLRDLRISVTDRCNFRCIYCMPKTVFGRDYPFLAKAELLSYEEITRITRVLTGMGIGKVRLTGGEPLLRRDLDRLIGLLAEIPGLELALTTNGSALAGRARELKQAGLKRITVSLDAMDETVFRRMNDADYPVARVLAGIDAAADAGLGPVKVNAVIKRGVNDGEVLALARHFRGSGHVLRFIEYMDVGNSNDWRHRDLVPAEEIVDTVHRAYPLEFLAPNFSGEVAQRWRYRDGAGEIGVVASVTRAFCSTCTRLRLSTDGQLYTCLFASDGHDLRRLLRQGAGDTELRAAVAHIWSARDDRYSELRMAGRPAIRKIEMSYIGG